jgi:predicted ferric reductase
MKRNWLLLFGVLFVTVNFWILSKSDIQTIFASPFLSLAQITGLIGAILISIELIFSSRTRITQVVFGPLDKLYKYHRYIGVAGVISLIFHASFLILNSNNGLIYFVPSPSNFIYATGILALYAYILTVGVSLYLDMPYHIWKFVHKVLALATLGALFHMLNITSDISRSMPLRIWIFIFFFLGVASMLYKVFFYIFISPRYRYKIISKTIKNDVTVLDLEPVSKKINIKPGQFAFLKFDSDNVSGEDHPFSMISDGNLLKVAIKNLGDFSAKAKDLTEGEFVSVYGPHGGFGEKLFSGRNQVWIAGGIGITPFISFLFGLQQVQRNNNIQLYYCTKCNDDAYFDKEIKELSNIPNFQYINFQSEISGHLSGDNVLKNVLDIENTDFFLCGPEGMVSSLENHFVSRNVKRESIIKEDFNFLGNK